jgi:hypothetical protein
VLDPDGGSGCGGQGDDEAAAGVVVGVDGDGAVVPLDDVTDDGQAEPGSAGGGGAGVIQAGEAFEDVLALVGGDAGTVVGDAQDRGVVVLGEGERDRGVGGRRCR